MRTRPHRDCPSPEPPAARGHDPAGEPRYPVLTQLPAGSSISFKHPNPLRAGSLRQVFLTQLFWHIQHRKKHLGAEISVAPKCPQNLGRGPKPNATVPRRGGDGRTRGAHYKYKIIICYKQKNIYCTSLTHIHKNTIYTERLGGARALQGGGFGRCCSPAPCWGLYRQHISPQKSRQAYTHRSNRAWME